MSKITRRTFCGAGATMLLGTNGHTQPNSSPSGQLPPLTAEILFLGELPVKSLCIFDIREGRDMGTYVAKRARYAQRCIRVRHASVPHFFVDFRPDLDSDRIEVVFWNGECLGDVPSGYTRDLPTYVAVVKRAGNVVHSEQISKHVWGCRWRYQSEPRKEIRTATQVFADGFLPHMSKKAARIGTPYSGVIVPRTPAGVGSYRTFMEVENSSSNTKLGLVCDVDRGGERHEIGLVTEWQADYLLNGTASSRNAMYQQAELCGSDWHFYLPDQTTGALVNYKQDAQHYNCYTLPRPYGQKGQYYQIGGGPAWNGWNIHEADSHVPSMFYVPFALTEDAYYIEGQQAIVQWGVGWDIYGRETLYGKLNGPRTCCSYTGEIRTMGWGVRNLAMAYKISPEQPPSWLLSKNYYAALSHDYSAVIDNLWTRSPNNLHSIFRQLSNDPYFQTFEQAYAIMGIALADMVGMPANPSWHSALEFYFGMLDGTLSGKSGWDHQVPCPHDIPSRDFSAFNTWGEAYERFRPVLTANASFPNAPSPGNRQGGSIGNTSQVYAACAFAKRQGVTTASRCVDWLNEYIDFNYSNQRDRSGGVSFYMKCGVDGT
jgi:hypothetical protein